MNTHIFSKQPPLEIEGELEHLFEEVPFLSIEEVAYVGYTGALKAPVRCFGNHLSEKRKSLFQTDNKCGGPPS